MRRVIIFLLLSMVLLGACSKSKSGGVKLKSDADSVAYIIGMNVGMNLMKMDSALNINALCEGLRDACRGAAKLSVADAETYYLRHINVSKPQKAMAYEEQFLEDIRSSNRNYARTSSGVTYTVETLGDQDQIPTSDRDTIVISYLIRTADGQEIYASHEHGGSERRALGELRQGVRESLKLIGRGGKINAWMPAATAYGAEGDASLGIGPNTTLYYEIELLEVDKYANRRR